MPRSEWRDEAKRCWITARSTSFELRAVDVIEDALKAAEARGFKRAIEEVRKVIHTERGRLGDDIHPAYQEACSMIDVWVSALAHDASGEGKP